MKKSEEKKLEKFQIAKLTAEQQVEVKGGNDEIIIEDQVLLSPFVIRDDLTGI